MNLIARDFAKLGELYHCGGVWQRRSIVPAEWVRASVTPDKLHLKPGSIGLLPFGYGYQWRVPEGERGEIFAAGVYNQFMFVDRSREVVIVKLSANRHFGTTITEVANRELIQSLSSVPLRSRWTDIASSLIISRRKVTIASAMQWDELEVFLCVAELGSFTRSAERLGRPKSTVSRAVAALEARLGERLLERSSRSVRLTDAGRDLLARAKPHVTELNDILNEHESLSSLPRGMLRIAASYEIVTQGLFDILPDLLSTYPELQATIEITHHLVDPIESGYDLLLYQSQTTLPDSSIVARHLYDVEFGIFAAPPLVRKYGLPKSPDELQSWPMVTTSVGQVWQFAHTPTGRIHSYSTQPRLSVPSAQGRLRAAEKGCGVAVLSTMLCKEAVAARRLVRILPDFVPVPLAIYALLPSRKVHPARVTALLNAFAQRFGGGRTRR
ncbi:LysR substrate-binding domain-containing protein [Caballeronia sp. 15711]|uniref:LysR substrate-binding domain-containing protein n=1 Tax=Caballeronia sp. 15711 TaxID=3391029 RepID=UPI0039E6C353